MCLKIVNSKLLKTFFIERKMNFSKINCKKIYTFYMLKIKTGFSRNQLKILMKYSNVFLYSTYTKAYIKIKQIASQEMEKPIVLTFFSQFFLEEKKSCSSPLTTFSSTNQKHTLPPRAEETHLRLFGTKRLYEKFY